MQPLVLNGKLKKKIIVNIFLLFFSLCQVGRQISVAKCFTCIPAVLYVNDVELFYLSENWQTLTVIVREHQTSKWVKTLNQLYFISTYPHTNLVSPIFSHPFFLNLHPIPKRLILSNSHC